MEARAPRYRRNLLENKRMHDFASSRMHDFASSWRECRGPGQL